MKIIVGESYEVMSQQAADAVVKLMHQYERPLISPASGDSPAGLYGQLVRKAHNGSADPSKWSFVSLDEWEGMNGNDEGSCRYHLDRQLFIPLNVRDEQVFFFDGRANLELECTKADQFIDERGGIAVAIVGLGMNGHIGMNEPGTPPELGTHIADIAPITQQTGQKYFKESRILKRGITLGMSTIMKAQHVVLVVNGQHKADIVHQVINSAISAQIPGTLLRDHPDFTIFLDKAAALHL